MLPCIMLVRKKQKISTSNFHDKPDLIKFWVINRNS